MRILKCLFIGAILFNSALYSQINPFFKQPQLMPNSPEAAILNKVSDIPVDFSSGTANISIPIYTIEDGQIAVPVSIDYHTGGIKVQDVASSIGLGWNLEFGAGISVKSELCDPVLTVDNSAFKQNSDLSTGNAHNAVTFLINLTQGRQEKQKPEYYFHFGKYFGSFYWDINNHLFVKGNQNLIIAKNGAGFDITTDEGIRYSFLSPESVTSTNGWTKNTALFITSINDLNTHRVVTFKYKTSSFVQYHDSYATCYNLTPAQQGNFCSFNNSDSYTKTMSTISNLVIDTIRFSSGFMKFNSSSDRSDLDPIRITGISVYDNNGHEIKRFLLNQSYFVSSGAQIAKYNYRLKLDSLALFDVISNLKVEPYSFYYDNTSPPAYMRSDGHNWTGVDYWDYFNNQGNATTMPKEMVNVADYAIYPGLAAELGYRSPDPAYNQVFSLKRIKYPTGGYTLLTYEANQVSGYYLGNVVGGLRIQSIKYFNDWTDYKPLRTKYFKYDSGMMQSPFSQNGYVYTKTKTVLCSLPNSCPVPMLCRTDYQTRNVSSDAIGSNGYLLGNPYYYQVEELDQQGSVGPIKIIYYFDKVKQVDYFPWPAPEYDNLYFTGREWVKSGLLIKKETYNTISPTSYVLIKKEENQYLDSYVTNPQIGLHAVARNGYDFCGQQMSDMNPYSTDNDLLQGFNAYNAYNSWGIRYLTQKTITEYSGSDSLVTINSFVYNIQSLASKSTVNSDGNVYKSYYYYPNQRNDAINDSLTARNIISPVIEDDEFVNSTLISKSFVNYKLWNLPNSSILPETRQYQNLFAGGNLETRLQYYSYDNYGNTQSVSKSSDAEVSYIWGYNEKYPIAEVKNADISQIAYTSFEDVSLNSGNWNISTTSRGVGDGVTGIQYLNTSCTITSPVLNSAKTYIVSYWTKNVSPFSITGTQAGYPKKGKSVGSWSYYEHVITGTSSAIINMNGSIDELRLFPQNAIMITKAYTPLVGISNECDRSCHIISYNYDGLGRMQNIRNQDNNIIKTYNYSYDPKLAANKPLFFNDTVSVTGSVNCSPGYYSNVVGYRVPGGKYSSLISQPDANNQATTDATNNAQAYINANSVCTLATLMNVTYLNSTPKPFRLTLVSTQTSQSFTFTLNANVTGTPLTVGQIPEGTYNVTMTGIPYNASYYSFTINTTTRPSVQNFSVNGIQLLCLSCGSVNIH